MYADMTCAWKIDNKKRVVIDFGGVYFQILLLMPMSVLSICTNNTTYTVACLYIILFTVANLNPFFKLDGYWILSDFFKLDNLSSNAFKVVSNIICRKKINLRKSYILGSIVYVISTVLIIILGFYLFLKSIINNSELILKFKLLTKYIINYKLSESLIILNQLLFMLIPFIFVGIILINIVKRIVFNFHIHVGSKK